MINKKILVVSQFYSMGGAEEQLKILIDGLRVDNEVYSYISCNKSLRSDSKNKFIKYSYFNDYKLFGYFLSLIQLLYVLLFNLPKIDKIIIFRYRFIYWIPFIFLFNKNIILSIRVASNKLKKLYLFKYICDSFVLKIIVNSKPTSLILDSLNLKSKIINNAIKAIDFKESRIINRKEICYAARIHPSKNQEVAIKCLIHHDDLEIHFYGNISDQKYYLKLLKITKDLNLEKQVKFFKSKRSIDIIFQRYSIFILGSFEEGMSNLIMECLSNRKIILASNILANKFLIKDNWETFCPTSEDSLSKILFELKTQTDSYLNHKLDSISTEFNLKYSKNKLINNFKKELV